MKKAKRLSETVYIHLPIALRPFIARLAKEDFRSAAAEIPVLLVEAIQERLGKDAVSLADLSQDNNQKSE